MNGNLIGALNTPTLASAPGVWDIEELKAIKQYYNQQLKLLRK